MLSGNGGYNTNKVIKYLVIVVILVGIVGVFLTCEDKMMVSIAPDLIVEMRKSTDMSDVLYLGIDLPSSGHEDNINFILNDVVYQSISVISVQNPKIVFENNECDDFLSVILTLPNSVYDNAVLCVTTNGDEELYFYAKGTDFYMLLEYLSQN